MKAQYGDSCLNQGRVYEWVEWFQNRRQNMSHSSAYNIIPDDPGYRKVYSRWVPRQFFNDQKRAWQTICQEHLDRHAWEDAFLRRILTGDQSWMYHYEPESKRQLMQWKYPLSPANKKFKTQGFLWESHADHLLGCQWSYIGAVPGKRVNLWLVLDTLTAEARETPGTSLKRTIVASRQRPPQYGCAYSGYTTCSEIWGVETSTIESGLGAIGLSLVCNFERTFAGPEVCRWQRCYGGGAKLVKYHTKKLFSRGHPQACGQVDHVCCEEGGLCRKIRHKQFLYIIL
jgi:hypothetical protein